MNYLLALHISKDLDRIRKRKKYIESFKEKDNKEKEKEIEKVLNDKITTNDNLTAEDILNQLKEKTISCKDVTFKILGLSLATINTIISFLLSVIMLKKFYNYEKNK